MSTERLIIGITGPSCSFKTTIAERLDEYQIADRFRGDHFYYGTADFQKADKPFPMRGGLRDWDSPDSIDLSAMAETLRNLKCGAESVELPVYDRKIHDRTGEIEIYAPKTDAIVVDSLFAGHKPVFDVIDQLVVLEISDTAVFSRRTKRQSEGGGEPYSEEYHRLVMCPALAEMRPLWQRNSRLVFDMWDPEMIPRVVNRIAELVKEKHSADRMRRLHSSPRL